MSVDAVLAECFAVVTGDREQWIVLEEVLVRVEGATDEDPATTVDQEEVETRLEALGYLE